MRQVGSLAITAPDYSFGCGGRPPPLTDKGPAALADTYVVGVFPMWTRSPRDKRV